MEPTDFFVAGGTLRPQSQSYVPRPADDALLNHLLAGEFCYVLTPRQMGKSSLMVRTAARLRQQEVQTVIIDLTSIGSVTVDEWYLGVLSRIRSGLRLQVDVQEWWQTQALGGAQRFSTFLRDEVLGKIEERIVIFIDEIDSTLNLDFRDDFFAAVRALYNARANEPIFQRLSFAFLGVATPTELIQDRQRTPFNIGRRIDLQEFSFDDARPLQEGLDTLLPNPGQALLRRIFYWTSGHPYLTQKLCLLIAHHPERAWGDGEIDTLVARSFLSEEGRKDTNLTFIQDRLLSSPAVERRALLTLYRQVYNGKAMPDDDRSPVQNRLELYGLLKVKDQLLHVRNEIYRQVFDGEWISANTPVNSQRRVAIGAVVVALLLVSLSALYFALLPDPDCDVFVKQFRESPAAQTVRISSLASLFDQSGRCDMDAITLFYELPKAEQKKLFLFENPQSVQADLRTVVEKLSQTLDWAEDGHDQKLMESMIAQLQRAGVEENDSLVQMLQHWRDGRVMADKQDFDKAITEYTLALAQVAFHPILYYDRAMAYIATENYTQTLNDLNLALDISQLVTPTPTPLPTSTPVSGPIPSPNSPPQTDRESVNGSSDMLTTTVDSEIVGSAPLPLVSPAISSILTDTTNTTSYRSRFTKFDGVVATVRDAIRNNAQLATLITNNLSSYPNLLSLAHILQDDPIHDITFVYVPAGEFLMGSSEEELASPLNDCLRLNKDCTPSWFADEQPQHKVDLDAFWIMQTEVTNAQYERCVAAKVCIKPNNDIWDKAEFKEYPVVNVDWNQANEYAKWVGGRLPTEAEWEKAARGSQGRVYPWGNQWDGNRLNYCNEGCNYEWKDSTVNDGYARTAPVGSYPQGASPYGALDMAGNVWEWVADWYDSEYYGKSPLKNPQGPITGVYHLARGGSWFNTYWDVRSSGRNDWFNDDLRYDVVGFRVVRLVSPGS